jgi:hypothetical protein
MAAMAWRVRVLVGRAATVATRAPALGGARVAAWPAGAACVRLRPLSTHAPWVGTVEEGNRLMRGGQFRAAARAYESVLALVETPEALYNLALAMFQLRTPHVPTQARRAVAMAAAQGQVAALRLLLLLSRLAVAVVCKAP